MVSRVGADDLGREIRARVQALRLDDVFLQMDGEHPTGTVRVSVDSHGQPTFTITPDVAYDHLAWDEALEALARLSKAICFGTLVQRSPAARATVQRVLKAAPGALIVYDVNLRQHFYDRHTIEKSLAASHWVKLNDQELLVLRELLALDGSSESELLESLRQRYALELAALTRGAKGCLLRSAMEEIDLPGIPIQVVDTVGAGDAFTAGLLVSVLEGQSLHSAATFANRLAARVAASAGGTPRLERTTI
jgi:fructokinase